MQSVYAHNHNSLPSPELPRLSRVRFATPKESSGMLLRDGHVGELHHAGNEAGNKAGNEARNEAANKTRNEAGDEAQKGVTVSAHVIRGADLMWRLSVLRQLARNGEIAQVIADSADTAAGRAFREMRDCVAHIRTSIYKAGLKSSNKRNDSKRSAMHEEMRTILADREIAWTAACSHLPQKMQIDAIRCAQGHNCDQLAQLTCDQLSERLQRGGYHVYRVAIPSFHAAVIATPAPLPSGRLPNDLSQLPKDCFVADAWANIVCRADEYQQKFRAQMHKWAAQNKRVRTNDGVWLSPADPKWVDRIDEKKCVLIDLCAEFASVPEEEKTSVFRLYRDAIDVLTAGSHSAFHFDQIFNALLLAQDRALREEMLQYLRSSMEKAIADHPGGAADRYENYARTLEKMSTVARTLFESDECGQWMQAILQASAHIPTYAPIVSDAIANELVLKEASQPNPDPERLAETLDRLGLPLKASHFRMMHENILEAGLHDHCVPEAIEQAYGMASALMAHVDKTKTLEVVTCLRLLVDFALLSPHELSPATYATLAERIEALAEHLDNENWLLLQSQFLEQAEQSASPELALERLVKLELRPAMDKWCEKR
jgi:hypothetical protein